MLEQVEAGRSGCVTVYLSYVTSELAVPRVEIVPGVIAHSNIAAAVCCVLCVSSDNLQTSLQLLIGEHTYYLVLCFYVRYFTTLVFT